MIYYPDAVRRALVEEADCRELGPAAIARGAAAAGCEKVSAGRIRNVLCGVTPNPSVGTVAVILAGLGRDWAWLGREVERHAKSLEPCEPDPTMPL